MSAAGSLLEIVVRFQIRVAGGDRERGDVPGWVLITLMTAAIVTVIWGLAQGKLVDILGNALDSVTGPGD